MNNISSIARLFDGSSNYAEFAPKASRTSAQRPTVSQHRQEANNYKTTDRSGSAHRQRTQDYIKALENEILQLREREKKLEEESTGLKDYIGLLKQSHIENGIFIPEPSSDKIDELDESTGTSVMVDLTEMQAIEAERWCSTTAAESEPQPYEPPKAGLFSMPPASEQPGLTVKQLNTQTGINFILE
jgi:hypothetical protein